ncbi:MAG TPA: hypothetical protein VMS43_01175 [Allosphingosinicella sp.]|nr:hypothetical protein [Allosphingosinicella sp.]
MSESAASDAIAPGAPAGDRQGLRVTIPLYLSVAFAAGAVIALQLTVMRLFTVGSWAHFGSLVVSLAMLGFGLASAIMTVFKGAFERHWHAIASGTLLAFGPVMVVSNLIAQQLPFNPIFLISDPNQKWRLLANYVLYFLPFLLAAFFLGIVFVQARKRFGRVYAADLVGAGIGGVLVLPAMYLLHPADLMLLPLLLWTAASACWFLRSRKGWIAAAAIVAMASVAGHLILPQVLGLEKLAVSDYKGVSYARKFPASRRVYERSTPFGLIEVYASSYLHIAPGLSDNAAFNLDEIPENAYLGLYIDGEGPIGIMADLPQRQTGYFRFLPMIYPYLLKQRPEVFVVQLSGGISTMVALRAGARHVTAAEGNRAVREALLTDPTLRRFTGDLLNRPNVTVVDQEGRHHLAHSGQHYDVIDFSLADSAGLSSPGGFAIVEKYAYTREAMLSYMRALRPGGILSVTLWNKEEPPKSVLKLYTTMAAAAHDFDAARLGQSFFVVSTYLGTTTVLYKQGGFTPGEIATLQAHSRAMSFDTIYYPGMPFDAALARPTLDGFRQQIFGAAAASSARGAGADPTADPTIDRGAANDRPTIEPATTVGRLVWHSLVRGTWEEIAPQYVFDTRPLTNQRPYFAAYVRPGDLPGTLDRLELFQGDWGYLLIWATLGVATFCALLLILIPLAFGWRTLFSRMPGKGGTILFFSCLGLGYIMVEVALIAEFVLALTNPIVSSSLLITVMLVFSGLGSLVSERFLGRSRHILPLVLGAIGAILLLYAVALGVVLDAIGGLAYGLRILCCVALVFPPAFLMGFPMATAMAGLTRVGKEAMFVWAWGVNGCFSVIGSAAVPLVATAWGLSSVLMASAIAYLIAIPAFLLLLRPAPTAPAPG